MDDRNLQNENLEATQTTFDNLSPKKEGSEIPTDNSHEQITSDVTPRIDFTNNIQNENIITIKVEQNKNGLAVASMVCGIIGAVFGLLGMCGACCCCWPVTVIVSIVAIVLAIVDRVQRKAFCGMAIAGLICGIIGIVAPIVIIIIQFFFTYAGNYDVFMEEFWEAYYESYEQFQ